MNPVIIIPTFISARRRKEGGSLLTTYDHTTPISQPGELPRLLHSLQKVRGIGQIVILVASEPSIENQAAEKVQIAAAQYPSLNIAVVGAPELALVQQRMEQLGLGKLSKEIGLSGYGAIRNSTTPTSCKKQFMAWGNSQRRAFPFWRRRATTSTPRARFCRRARTSGTTISGSRAKPSIR